MDALDQLFVITAFLFQVILIAHFSLRKWAFDRAMRYGPVVYALCIPAAVVSALIFLGGKPWYFWLGGFLYFIWACFGYWSEYIRKIEWRNPIRWPIFIPYIILYLATSMFYWFPLMRLSKPLWYVYAVLYVISTILNVTSHQRPLNTRA